MTIRGASDTSPPTDLELMLYADGELADDRLAAVQAWLDREPLDGDDARAARNKLTALGMVSDLVRAQALDASAGADDIADAVMRRIEAEAVESSAPLVMMGGPVASTPTRPAPAPPANDNARRFYVIAAAIVAAAAAVLFWVRSPATPDRGEVAQLAAPRPAASALTVLGPDAPRPEADVDHGVEVAAVDFGARMGAVFYVPNGTSASSTTTVVWLSDDSAGENQ
jgi:hypothetical protein